MKQPLTLEQWSKDQVRREQLAEVLDNSVFQDAIETLLEIYTPTVPSVIAGDFSGQNVPDAAALNNVLALRFAHRAAFFGFHNALRNLTRDRLPRRSSPIPWGGTLVSDDLPANKNRRKP